VVRGDLLISAGFDALAPLCPGSSTTVLITGTAGGLTWLDGDSSGAGFDEAPEAVVAGVGAGDRTEGEEAGAVGGSIVPHAASATRHASTARS
jgi:hypothetical protein